MPTIQTINGWYYVVRPVRGGQFLLTPLLAGPPAANSNNYGAYYNNMTSMDVQLAQPDLDYLNQMMLPNPVMLNEAPGSQYIIDSMITTAQNVQNIASSHQEVLYNLDETFTPNNLTPQSHTFPSGDWSENTDKENMLQEMQREMMPLNGSFQPKYSELYTAKSKYEHLAQLSLDMNKSFRILSKQPEEYSGGNAMGQEGGMYKGVGYVVNI